MTLSFLIVVTLCSVAWSLWVRRLTWHCSWEMAATLNIALQGAAVLLMSPWASHTLGEWLYHLTGHYNLEDYLGHDCYVVAASAIAFNVLGRLRDGQVQQRAFKLWVEAPATLCIPLLLAAFTFSTAGDVNYADFFTAPTDPWLHGYWLLLCATLIWLLAYGGRATIRLLQDPRSRSIARIYLISSGCGIAACSIRIITSMATTPVQENMISSLAVWVTACACGAGFALTSAYSWRAKQKWFTPAR